MTGLGWFAAIIVGGLAGWIAEKIMKSDMGLIMNIILGIIGALVANFLLMPSSARPWAAGSVSWLSGSSGPAC